MVEYTRRRHQPRSNSGLSKREFVEYAIWCIDAREGDCETAARLGGAARVYGSAADSLLLGGAGDGSLIIGGEHIGGGIDWRIGVVVCEPALSVDWTRGVGRGGGEPVEAVSVGRAWGGRMGDAGEVWIQAVSNVSFRQRCWQCNTQQYALFGVGDRRPDCVLWCHASLGEGVVSRVKVFPIL